VEEEADGVEEDGEGREESGDELEAGGGAAESVDPDGDAIEVLLSLAGSLAAQEDPAHEARMKAGELELSRVREALLRTGSLTWRPRQDSTTHAPSRLRYQLSAAPR